jgi:predicted acylesterase/phospholipase RssA
MAICRVLSLDGGGQLEMTSTLLLQEIEMRRPGFLRKVDVLAGTSAGGFVSLILATEDDPASLLGETERLWENFTYLSMNTIPGAIAGFFGFGAMFSNQGLRDYLAQEHLLGNKTLGELRKKVVITSFRLDHTDHVTGRRQWKPKIFHNFGSSTEPDMSQRAVDVALRSGAAPIAFPIVDGYVDGGVVANHPALIAISVIVDDWKRGVDENPDDEYTPLSWATKDEVLQELRVLSIGVGEDQQYVEVDSANWGWFNWILNPMNPLLAINALLRGDMWAINFECMSLLPDGNYHRLNPHYLRHTPIPFMANTGMLKKTVQSAETQQMVDETIEWIDRSGWLD